MLLSFDRMFCNKELRVFQREMTNLAL